MPQPEPTTGDTAWFIYDRFGMFVHWGLYAPVIELLKAGAS